MCTANSWKSSAYSKICTLTIQKQYLFHLAYLLWWGRWCLGLQIQRYTVESVRWRGLARLPPVFIGAGRDLAANINSFIAHPATPCHSSPTMRHLTSLNLSISFCHWWTGLRYGIYGSCRSTGVCILCVLCKNSLCEFVNSVATIMSRVHHIVGANCVVINTNTNHYTHRSRIAVF